MSLNKIRKFSISFILLLTLIFGAVFCLPISIFAETQEEFEIVDSTEKRTQGNLNLCWAYAGSRMVENYYYRVVNNKQGTFDISEEWLSLCYMQENTDKEPPVSFGDSATIPDIATIINNYGIVLQSEYNKNAMTIDSTDPEYYKKLFDECKKNADKETITNIEIKQIFDYEQMTSASTDTTLKTMKKYLLNNSMFVTAANNFYIVKDASNENYVFALSEPDALPDALSVNHSLVIVGYDDNQELTVADKIYKGAFKTINSDLGEGTTYDESKFIVYVPYEMFAINSETLSKIVSNTYCITSMTAKAQNATEATVFNAIVPNAEDGPITPSEEEEAEKITQVKKTLMIFAGLGFVAIVGAFVIPEILSKVNANMINKRLAYEHLMNYEYHKQQIEIKKEELEIELEEIRQQQIKRKQRRMKRMFAKVQAERNKPIE